MQYKTAAYTAINPLQRVPVLMVDELWISTLRDGWNDMARDLLPHLSQNRDGRHVRTLHPSQ